jgi:hypothetical protein
MDFDITSIEVNAATQAWGPYRFDFQGALPDPTGDLIVSGQVKSYLNGTETTVQLIHSAQLESTVIKIWFNYPGVQYHGKHTLLFHLTNQKGGVNSCKFGFVDAK